MFFSSSLGHQVDEVYAEPFIRVSDFNVTLGEKRFLELTKKEVKVPINSDFLKVTVRFKDGSEQTDFHASISEIPDVVQRKETHDAPLNIMVLGLDRTSSAHFQRMTPKTYAFLKDQLDSIIFKSYSIVGENTAPALSAFLTGKSLKENCAFKEARKGFKNAGRVDDWPFIFSDLKTLGIPTMWSEDQPPLGKSFPRGSILLKFSDFISNIKHLCAIMTLGAFSTPKDALSLMKFVLENGKNNSSCRHFGYDRFPLRNTLTSLSTI